MTWQITDGGVLSGGSLADFYALTDDGTSVVGKCTTSGGAIHAVQQPGTVSGSGLWSTNGAMVDLGVIAGGTSSQARAISQDGLVIVGFSNMTIDNGNAHAVAFVSSAWHDLGNGASPPPHPGQGGTAWSVSSDGSKIAGFYSTTIGANGIVWTQSGGAVSGFVEIPPPAGDKFVQASSIGRDGVWVAGWYTDINGHPSTWKFTVAGGFVDLGRPSGTTGAQNFDAHISDDGTKVATAHTLTSGGLVHAFLCSGTTWQDLGCLPGGTTSQANGISPDGTTIVGTSNDATGSFHGFIWTASTGMRQLPDLFVGGTAVANAVNSSKTLISGVATTALGAQHGVVWSLVTVGGGAPTAPPSVKVADLWFGSTGAFVDMTLVANRRKFISAAGGAQNLGADGSSPFQRKPSIFLSVPTGGTPAQFATNFGNGGTFAVTGGTLATASPAPPGTSNTVTVTKAPSLGVGVLGDYRNGNLYAFNMDTLTDNGAQRRWLRSWRATEKPPDKPIRHSSIQIDMETGSTQVPTGTKPQVVLRWSDDGGKTWSGPRIIAAGPVGAVAQNVRATRLGSTRRFSRSDRIYELSSTDQFKVAIVGAELEVS